MKHFFLLIFVLLIVLGSVLALKQGETKVVNVKGVDYAVTYNELKNDGFLDLSKTIYLGENANVGIGETTKLTDASGNCLYYVTGKSFSEEQVEVIVSKCESTINGLGEGDIELIYPDASNPNFCFSVEHTDLDDNGNPILKVDVPEICKVEIPLPPVPGAEPQEPFLIEADGQCFLATVLETEPEVKIEVNAVECPAKTCPLPEKEQKTTYNLVDDACFSTTTLCLEPLQLKVDSADYSVCKMWEAQKDCTTIVSKPEPEYILVDDQCFETTTLCTIPVKVYVNSADKSKCEVTTTTDEEVKQGDGSKKDEGSGDGDKGAKEDAGLGGGGGGGSMSGVPLNIPKSKALFNDGYCKTQLHKQTCKDGYRTYKCQAYNIKGEFKQYKEECASCNNNKQDANENGVDCGGICANKCLVTEEGKGTITQPSFGKTEGAPIVTEPSAFEKYRIPIIILIAIIGLIVGMVLWIHKPKQEGYTISATQTQKEKEDIPARLKGIPNDEVDSMKKYIKTQLGKGVDRQKITSILESIGWKQEIIDYIFDEMQHHVLPAQYEEQLRRYIGYYIHKGVAQDKIKATLLKSGWQEEVINKILVDLK